jgi:hypothetical protein
MSAESSVVQGVEAKNFFFDRMMAFGTYEYDFCDVM